MANYGNTGQHYKMATRTSFEIQPDEGVIFHKSCGHDDHHCAPWTADYAATWIGKRTRCDQCPK